MCSNKFFDDSFGIKITNLDIKVKNIIETTDFNYMKNTEAQSGFDEAMPWSSFFRKGKKEEWKKILNNEQQLKIEENFKNYMKNYNYY